MQQKLSKYAIYPLVPLDNGQHSISDETLIYIWRRIEEEGKVQHLFYDGSIRDAADWLKFIKRNDVFPVIVWNTERKRIAHVVWLKDCFDCCAYIHHCAIGPYQRGVWEAVRDHLKQFDSLKLLLGLTPKINTAAVKMLTKICKFNIVGEIPYVCNMAYTGDRVPGILSYFEL